MCGITGILAFSDKGRSVLSKIKASNDSLSLRGPDGEGIYTGDEVALGHRRLAIIDISANAAQPMTDPSGRYSIIFNGEIFNYRELRERFFPDKDNWRSQSDTEILLHLFIMMREKSLRHLSGFFALAIYDKQNSELFIARDRFGKKPLHFYRGQDFFAFASEMKALLHYDIPKAIDHTSLAQYLQFNYIPQPQSILRDVQKLKPGHYLYVSKSGLVEAPWYELDVPATSSDIGFDEACRQLVQKMSESVKKRLISDVPLGAFLSGGIDSSVVVALASRHTRHLNTFSIGYKDNPFFDETRFADLVAKKYETNHTVFSLTNNDFLEHIDNILAYIDEPYADSSAIPVYILSKHTRKHVTVALSGDGGDEVFGGYNKHHAEWRMRKQGLMNSLVTAGGPIWKMMPQSRSNRVGNLFRQLNRFATGAKLGPAERYWNWAGFLDHEGAMNLLTPASRAKVDIEAYDQQKKHILRHLNGGKAMEDFLRTDMELVLLSDMLTKVDLMSMANCLEIRSPFLDHEVVEFAFSLPTSFKIDRHMKKKIVQDAFRSMLPAELYNRPKQGFEIPLLGWFRKELRSRITDDLLEDSFIEEQGIFEPAAVRRLKAKLFSSDPGDAHATVWALMVFQSWWRKYYVNY